MPKNKPTTIDEYFAPLPADQRAALQKLRKAVKAAAPKAEECINYGLAAFRMNGKSIAGLGAAANHLSYYPMSGSITNTLAADLKGYETSKGAIRFPVNKPLPAPLVRKLVKARIAEIASTGAKSRSK
jgi:uncharacterized protein YdhG (YjbR/CyaY superfamily)